MPFAGFDVARYPGDDRMQSLWDNSNLQWVGFYLPVSGPGLSDKLTWKGKFSTLTNIGWGVAPIYVGKQPNSHKLKDNPGSEGWEGFNDGMEAAYFASNEAMPSQTVLYFDLEMPNNSAAWKQYYFMWAQTVFNQGYLPGLYCSYLSARDLVNFVRGQDPRLVPEIWVYDLSKYVAHAHFKDLNSIPTPEPANAHGVGATSWQYVQGTSLNWPGNAVYPVDLNTSAYSDPGQRTQSADWLDLETPKPYHLTNGSKNNGSCHHQFRRPQDAVTGMQKGGAEAELRLFRQWAP